MANFFSADYWKAFYFTAMSGTGTVDPNAMSGSFAGLSAFVASLTATGSSDATPRRRGGKDDGRKLFRRRRRAYVEFTDKRLEEIRRRERKLYDDLLDEPPEVAVAVQEPLPPPPLPIAERKSLPPAVEYDRLMALMSASLNALSENATRLANEQLRKQAKAAKVELPSKDEAQREQELRSMVVWLSSRAAYLEEQRLEAERIAQEQDEEEVIMLLLAA